MSSLPERRHRIPLTRDSAWIEYSYRGMQTIVCEHVRTEIIARRDGVDYVECLDCRQIFEAEDLEPVTVEQEDE